MNVLCPRQWTAEDDTGADCLVIFRRSMTKSKNKKSAEQSVSKIEEKEAKEFRGADGFKKEVVAYSRVCVVGLFTSSSFFFGQSKKDIFACSLHTEKMLVVQPVA